MLKEMPKKALQGLFGGKISTMQVLQTIASGMADCGVDVVIDPKVTVPCADSDSNKIYLPATVRSERALLVVSWYVDHESGHLIFTPSFRPIVGEWKGGRCVVPGTWATDSKILDAVKAEGYKTIPFPLLKAAKGLMNITEDSRMEHLMIKQLPGTRKHFLGGPLAAGLDTCIEDIFEKAVEIQKATGKANPPLSPFWVAEMHAYCVLDGWHGSKDLDICRQILPPHVGWVMDIIDDEYGDVKDVSALTFDSIVERTESASAKIIEKVLADAKEEEQEQQSGGSSQPQEENPWQDEFSKSKSESSSESDSDDEESDDDQEENEGNSEDSGEPQEGEDDERSSDQESGDSDSSDGEDFEEDDGASGGSESGSEESGESEDEESDAEGSSDGGSDDGDGEDDPSDSDASDDDDGDGTSGGEPGDEDEDSDSDSEDESGGGGTTGGSEDDEGDASDESGESGDDADGVDSEGDDGDEDGSEGDEKAPGDDSDGEDEGEIPEFLKDEEEEEYTEEAGDEKQLPRQVEEWANEAEADMADMMAGSDVFNEEEGGEKGDSDGTPGGGGPGIRGSLDQTGMPDLYYNALQPGLRTIVIEGKHLKAITDNPIFNVYDDSVKALMPPNMGAAARKLVGRFKSAPGVAYAGNRINPRRLAPIVAGRADGQPLMLRRNETVYSSKGVAVMLMLDCSGSMTSSIDGLQIQEPQAMKQMRKDGLVSSWRRHDSKFLISHAAMRSLAKVFSTAGVPFCAAGFTTCSAKHAPATKYGSSKYSRTDDIVNFIFKDFHETWNTTEKYMIAMNPFTQINYNGDHICANCNADGESILWAASRLLAREEAIKVLIVASDGMPAGGDGIHESAFLKYAVQRIENAGIYIGGLGIGTTYVKQFYRVSEVLPNFPPGKGTVEAAPIYLQNLMIRLVDRLMTEGGNNAQ